MKAVRIVTISNDVPHPNLNPKVFAQSSHFSPLTVGVPLNWSVLKKVSVQYRLDKYTGWSQKKPIPNFIFGITSVIQHRF